MQIRNPSGKARARRVSFPKNRQQIPQKSRTNESVVSARESSGSSLVPERTRIP
jgi:hypothetical protein